MKCYKGLWILMDSLEQFQHQKIHVRFETWCDRIYRSGSFKTAARETPLLWDLVAAQGVRWDKSGSQTSDGYHIFYGNGTDNHHIWRAVCVRVCVCVWGGVVESDHQLRG
jgi:hypothetical protein